MIGPLVALAAAVATPPQAPAPAPNLVVITLDTTRADRLGCYGASRAATPVLDALAQRGVRFDQALSPAPTTAPAHASMFTGRAPRRHGVRDNAGFPLGTDVPVLAEALRSAGYDTRAFVSSFVLDRSVGLDRGFAAYDDAAGRTERAGSRTIDAALDALPGMKPPFFLWVHLYDPHLPYAPPEPYAARFRDHPYDGEVAFMDAQIGRLLEAVKRLGGATVVAAAGDHGESLGEHGEDGHGIFLYQATQRVPLIVSGFRIPTGRTVTATVGLVDLAPTLLDLLGRPPLPGADGRSLVPLLRATSPTPVSPDYEMETYFPAFAYGWTPLKALVSGPLKYVDAPRPELYELPTDPRENTNLAKERGRSAKLEALAAELGRRYGDDAAAAPGAADEERRERLASLGYVGGSLPPAEPVGAIDPKDGIAWLADYVAAQRSMAKNRPAEAAATLTRLLGKNPNNFQALIALVAARQASGEWPQAVSAARRAVALAPKSALARFHLGNALAGESTTRAASRAEALRAFDEAIALSPRYTDVYLNAAAYLAGSRDVDGARRMLDRARAAGIADASIETALGKIEAARGSTTAAKASFERAVALDPGEAAALEGLGTLAFDAKDYAKAASWYARALEAAPSARLAKTLGAIRLNLLHDTEGARAAFKRALEIAPNDPDAEELRAFVSGTAE